MMSENKVPLKSKNDGTSFSAIVFIRAKYWEQWHFREICGAHTMLGPVILLYSATVIVSVVMYISTVNPAASLASVEVPYTILKILYYMDLLSDHCWVPLTS